MLSWSTIAALRYYAEKGCPQFQGAANFSKIIHNWFYVLNVKSLHSGQKKRDPYREPIFKEDGFQWNFNEIFLINFSIGSPLAAVKNTRILKVDDVAGSKGCNTEYDSVL